MSALVDAISVAREISLEPLRRQLYEKIPLYLVPGDPYLEAQLLALLRPAYQPQYLSGDEEVEPEALAFHVVRGEVSPPHHPAVLPLLWEGRLISLRVGSPAGSQGTVLRVPEVNEASFTGFIAPRIVELYPEKPLTLAVNFYGLKPTVVQRLVHATALANAELALVANLSGFVPLVGSFIGLGSELALLTKNQIIMLYKLALIHGYARDRALALFPEVLSIIASAFGWRHLARQLVSLLPAPLAVVPKAGIAYTATYLLGMVADNYFAAGRMPTRTELNKLWRAVDFGFPFR